MDDLTWDDLRLFLAAHRAGSFSRAAARLGVRQSTVSRRVATLEHALGGSLFHRTRTGLVPTALAEGLLDDARAAEAAFDRLRARVDDLADAPSGVVRIAVAPGLAHHWLIPHLPELHAAHPGLRFDVVVSMSLADLTRREADIALRFVPPRGEDLIARRLDDLQHAVLAHRRWADTPWETLPWVQLDVPDLPTPEAAWVRAHARSVPVLRSADWEAVLAAVRAGMGATVTTRRLVDQLPDRVVVEAPAPLPPPLPLWLVAHRSTRALPRVDVVWEALVRWSRT